MPDEISRETPGQPIPPKRDGKASILPTDEELLSIPAHLRYALSDACQRRIRQVEASRTIAKPSHKPTGNNEVLYYFPNKAPEIPTAPPPDHFEISTEDAKRVKRVIDTYNTYQKARAQFSKSETPGEPKK